MRTDSFPVEIGLPPLSDEAAVEIDDFLIDFLCLFESHYGDQIRRFYQDRSFGNLADLRSRSRLPDDDPPF
jgi:hypothetical protein